MTDNWDFYFLRVDDKPASIFVDLGIENQAPVSTLRHMAYVRLYQKHPREDGLSSQDEYDMLVQIEDALENALCGNHVGYVGRNTSNSCRDFYFYVSEPNAWSEKVDQAMAVFSEYEYETGTREDAGWSTYLDFLRPRPIDRQRIENKRVCESLERHGDALASARPIDHWSYFMDQSSADAYLSEIVSMGYSLREQRVEPNGLRRFLVQAWRSDVPSYENIDEVTFPLFEAAARFGGEYDGWECRVEK